MAIAYDTSSTVGYGTKPRSWSHTCSGSDRLLVVATFGGTDYFTAATYAGVSMTKIGDEPSRGGGYYYMTLWYLMNPASGTNTVEISGGTGTGFGGAVSYTGVAQTSALDASAHNYQGAGSTTNNQPITTTTDQCWLVACSSNDGGAPTAGTDTIIRTSVGVSQTLHDSNGAKSTGSNQLQLNKGTGNTIGWVIGAFKPVGAAGVNYTTSKTETVTFGDVRAYQWAAVYSKLESLGLTEISTVAWRAVYTGLDQLALSDQDEVLRGYFFTTTENLGVSTNHSDITSYLKTQLESLGLSDIAQLITAGVTTVDTLTLGDSVTFVVSFSVAKTDTISLSSLETFRTSGWQFVDKTSGNTWTFTNRTSGSWTFRDKNE